MSSNRPGPPHWAESLLARLLSSEKFETIAGDLYEEYLERRHPALGSARAVLWYVRQVLSFVPRFNPGGELRGALRLCSLVTAAGTLWLAVMEMLLRHAGYGARAAEALALTCVAMAGLVVCRLHLPRTIIRCLWISGALLVGVGARAFAADRRVHFEGFVAIIAAMLVMEGLLMLAAGTLLRAAS